jgi:hypothetical protein
VIRTKASRLYRGKEEHNHYGIPVGFDIGHEKDVWGTWERGADGRERGEREGTGGGRRGTWSGRAGTGGNVVERGADGRVLR